MICNSNIVPYSSKKHRNQTISSLIMYLVTYPRVFLIFQQFEDEFHSRLFCMGELGQLVVAPVTNSASGNYYSVAPGSRKFHQSDRRDPALNHALLSRPCSPCILHNPNVRMCRLLSSPPESNIIFQTLPHVNCGSFDAQVLIFFNLFAFLFSFLVAVLHFFVPGWRGHHSKGQERTSKCSNRGARHDVQGHGRVSTGMGRVSLTAPTRTVSPRGIYMRARACDADLVYQLLYGSSFHASPFRSEGSYSLLPKFA